MNSIELEYPLMIMISLIRIVTADDHKLSAKDICRHSNMRLAKDGIELKELFKMQTRPFFWFKMIRLKLILTFVASISLLGCKDNHYVSISGYSKDVDGSLVVLSNLEGEKSVFGIDTIKDGKFHIDAIIPSEGVYSITFSNKYTNGTLAGWVHSFQVYLEDNKTYIIETGSDQDILKGKFKVKTNSTDGQKLMEYQFALVSAREDLRRQILTIDRQRDAALDSGDLKKYRFLSELRIRKENYLAVHLATEVTRIFCRRNRNTVIAPFLLMRVNDMSENKKVYLQIFRDFEESVKVHKYGMQLARMLRSS